MFNKEATNQMVEHLNIILGNELVAINQYFLHAKILQDQGINKLAAKEREESIDEMNHADWIIARILFLKGTPNMINYRKLNVGANVKDMLQSDLDLEFIALKDLKVAIKYAAEINDVGSKELLEKILVSEESHQDFLEVQLSLIDQVGIQNYITTQI